MCNSNFSTAFGLERLLTANLGLCYLIERIDFTLLQAKLSTSGAGADVQLVALTGIHVERTICLLGSRSAGWRLFVETRISKE